MYRKKLQIITLTNTLEPFCIRTRCNYDSGDGITQENIEEYEAIQGDDTQ